MSSNEVEEIYEKLLKIYEDEGYVNPKAVLNYNIKELMREGRTRELAILQIWQKEKTKITERYELAREQQIAQFREKIDRLAVLFAKGEISEDSYKNAVKMIEENINRLRGGKDVPTVKEPFPTIPSEHEEKKVREEAVSKPSALWWLVPFFFGVIGGIVAYVGVKDDDQSMAENLLIFGILWSIIPFIIAFAII